MSDAPAAPTPDHPGEAEQPNLPEQPGAAIRLAAGLVALEAAGLVALAVAEIVNTDSDRPSVGVTTALFFFLYAAGLGFCARGLLRLSSWTRGPIVLAQLIELGVAWSFRGGDTTWVSVLLAIPAVIVLVVMFAPSTTVALYGHRLSDDTP
jgi:hypothetical protein